MFSFQKNFICCACFSMVFLCQVAAIEVKASEFTYHLWDGRYIYPYVLAYFLTSLSSWWFQSTHLKNIGQNGNLAQVGVKIENI